ncbi:uncharacterized protein LOC132545774 [Ylistrum balloti]|uniref:uncharacterized protein LOC132545774 n=1 Tax=Ylistrum balloti TaxID=509963 RepID=UPI002905CCD3|nr:uncharacterized protein LOC132545774 [Ylistrum balloti]
MMNILNFTEAPMKDDSIEEYEYHEYDPITGTNLNNPGELRINIEAQDLFTHPSESYLIIGGRLTKTDGTAYANDDNVTLTNNALMYLFSNIKYQLSGQEIESLFHPGQGTTMLGFLKYPDDFSKSQGLNQLWYKDTSAAASAAAAAGNAGFSVRQSYIIKSPDPKGTFSFRVPLKHIFGFCEDYDKIVYGMKQTLTLVRKTDNDAIFRNANVDDGKITLEKVSWFMPHVLPADAEKFQLYKTLDSNALLPVMYRIRQCDSISVTQSTSFTWRLSVKSAPERPRYIIVGFQTDKDGDQEQNPSIFDNVNVRNIFVMLNSARYPAVDYNLSFPKQQFSRAYGDAAAFRSKFYNMDELVSNPNITPADYKTLFPLFVFDVSKQSERLKTAVTDIQIKMQFNANVPAGTEAFAVVISDKMINFKTDGKKVNVVYS